MSKDKRSFFERLTGTISLDDSPEEALSAPESKKRGRTAGTPPAPQTHTDGDGWIEPEAEGELTVDVYQTTNEIIVKAMIAGVKPEDLDVSISRDMVTIRGHREEQREVSEDDYFHRELYWGSFTRTIMLPEEVDVDESIANEKNGMLTVRLPKVNKQRQAKLRVKSN